MTDKNNSVIVQLGQWQVIADENALLPIASNTAQSITVLPKVMTLLVYFIHNPNRLLTFDELNQAVWPKEVVGDNAIYNLVGQLRKVLGDKAAKPLYIETLSKKGYRLIAPVSEVLQQSVEPMLPSVKTINKSKRVGLLVAIVVIVVLIIAGISAGFSGGFSTEESKSLPDMARQFYTLGMFHQHKSGSKAKAMGYFQQTVAVAPDFLPAYQELAFANLQLAFLQEQAKSQFIKKTTMLADNAAELDGGAVDTQVLKACLQWWQGDKSAIKRLKQLFALQQRFSTSARLAYAYVLFSQGMTEQAIVHQRVAVNECPDCASAYKALATSQLVAMQMGEAFKNYQHYLELSLYEGADPQKLLGYSGLSFDKLKAMVKWYAQAPTSMTLQSSQRNTLALFHLTLEQQPKAQKLMNEGLAHQDQDFYSLYTLAAVAGAKGDFDASLAMLLKRHQLYPDNKRFAFSLALAYWMVGQTEQALRVLTQQVFEAAPKIPSVADDIVQSQMYRWQLYGALLIEQGNVSDGQKILTLLSQKMTSGLMADSGQLGMGYAGVLALLGQKAQALQHIQSTLASGWVADFNLNWWHLEDDPYLKALNDPQFKGLVADYHLRIQGLQGDTIDE